MINERIAVLKYALGKEMSSFRYFPEKDNESPSEKREFLSNGTRRRRRDYFRPDTHLNDREKKYCRCILSVGARNSEECLRERAWLKTRGGRTCYNPYAICHSSTGLRTQVSCDTEYELENIPENELIAYAHLKRIPIPEPYDREALLDELYNRTKKSADENVEN
jgi:hypothetical protein